MRISVALIMGGLCGIGLLLSTISNGDDRPKRSECIAGALLLWNCQECEKRTVLNGIPHAFEGFKDMPIAGIAVQDQRYVYVIFHDDCEDRNEFLHEVLESASQSIHSFPNYEILDRRIEPGPETIQVFGEAWSDGEAEWPPKAQ